jgi:integrase/recombinase XerD
MWHKLVGKILNRQHNIRTESASNSTAPTLEQHAMRQAATLTAQQLNRVLDYCKHTRHPARNRAILLTTHWAGLRIGEVAALLWADVVDSAGAVRNEFRLSAAQTKGNSACTVLIPQRLQAELERYYRAVKPSKLNTPVFATQRTAGFTANTLTHIVNGIYKSAGLVGATSHSGRRTFITNLASKGISVRVLASLAGHRSIAVTQKYIDVNDDMKRNAVELA